MNYETKITYTQGMLDTAVRKYWIRRHLGDAVMSLVSLAVASFFFFAWGFRNWFLGLIIGVTLLYTGITYGIFLAARARARAAFRAFGSSEVAWRFSDAAVFCESGAGKSELKWPMIKKLWRFKQVWLLFYANGAYSTLPVQTLPDDIRDFIERKVAEAGGQIR